MVKFGLLTVARPDARIHAHDFTLDWPTTPRGFQGRDFIILLASFFACATLYWIFVYYTAQGPGDVLQDGEPGILENSQAVLLFFSFAIAGKLSWTCPAGMLRLWLTLIAVGLFMIWGEEVSWGQWFFHWESPDLFLKHNIQSETNLHNLSPSWLARSRNALRVAIVTGGGIYPLVRRFLVREPFIPPWFAPRIFGVVPALFSGVLAAVARIPSLAPLGFEADMFELSEAEELFIYLFFLSYIVGIALGLRTASVARLAREIV